LFTLTKKILDAYYPPDEFYIFITYAPLGYGKSTYDFKGGVEVIQKVYHIDEGLPVMEAENAWEKLKQFIVFHPTQFFEKIQQIAKSRYKRVPFIIWEDMGLWLYALEYRNPFIEAFIKYLNVARTHLASIIGSSPSPEWVLRKLRRFPSAYTIRIEKLTNDTSLSNKWTWLRQAVGFVFWLHADLKHSGVRRIWVDRFYCKMPNDFYDWYKPLRDTYEDLALQLVMEKWDTISKKTKTILLANYPKLQRLPELKDEDISIYSQVR